MDLFFARSFARKLPAGFYELIFIDEFQDVNNLQEHFPLAF